MPCDKMPKDRMPKDEMPKRQNAFSKKVPDDRMPTETQCICLMSQFQLIEHL